VSHGRLFIEGVRQVDQQLASQLEEKMTASFSQNRSWSQAISESLDDKIYFWSLSLAFLCFSIIPFIGSFITSIAQTYLVSHKLSYRLLDTYFKIEKMNEHQQLQFVNKNWDLLFGFCLPFVFLASIPFLGPFALLYAEQTVGKMFCSEPSMMRRYN